MNLIHTRLQPGDTLSKFSTDGSRIMSPGKSSIIGKKPLQKNINSLSIVTVWNGATKETVETVN
jgi:hypothetical protein